MEIHSWSTLALCVLTHVTRVLIFVFRQDPDLPARSRALAAVREAAGAEEAPQLLLLFSGAGGFFRSVR